MEKTYLVYHPFNDSYWNNQKREWVAIGLATEFQSEDDAIAGAPTLDFFTVITVYYKS